VHEKLGSSKDAKQAVRPDKKPCLLETFPSCRVRWVLMRINAATGHGPEASLDVLAQENAAFLVKNRDGSRGESNEVVPDLGADRFWIIRNGHRLRWTSCTS
jgi:hypothetical protein